MRLGPTEAKERFEASPVARLATADAHGVPHIVPVTFAVDGDVVYFAVDAKPKSTWELRRLRNIEENPRVSLLTDHYASDWRQLWWARADGRARVWRERERCAGPVGLLRAKYPPSTRGVHWTDRWWRSRWTGGAGGLGAVRELSFVTQEQATVVNPQAVGGRRPHHVRRRRPRRRQEAGHRAAQGVRLDRHPRRRPLVCARGMEMYAHMHSAIGFGQQFGGHFGIKVVR
ncbi:hypothetical protein GCM10020000_33320 [Streptomyces olivoverticillatus]